nr:hypothetical protein CFP56_07687 [Quercus suber]
MPSGGSLWTVGCETLCLPRIGTVMRVTFRGEIVNSMRSQLTSIISMLRFILMQRRQLTGPMMILEGRPICCGTPRLHYLSLSGLCWGAVHAFTSSIGVDGVKRRAV